MEGVVEGVEVDSEVEGGGQADSGEGEGGGEKGGSVYSIRRRLATERKGVNVCFFFHLGKSECEETG